MDQNNENVVANKTGTYKYCFVPECRNTTISNPTKLFISVPKGLDRKKWIEITRRDPQSTSLKSSLFCCEDHFKIDEDLANYNRVKLDPEAKIFLKKSVLPRFFSCQKDRTRAFPAATRPGAEKLKRLRILEDMKQEQKRQTNIQEELLTNSDNENEALPIEDLNYNKFVFDKNRSVELPARNQKDVGVQVCIKSHYRSTGINCNLDKEKPQGKSIACSPIKILKSVMINRSFSMTSSSTNKTGNEMLSSEEYIPSTQSSEEYFADKIHLQRQAVEMRITRISNKPKSYIGVIEEAFFIMSILAEESKLKFVNICLTLEKIKLDLPFNILADEYGISLSNANTIYNKTVPVLAHFLRKLIFWPSSETIKASLPLPYRARYSNVQSIIDCFEIQIQKPNNALHQALTWSDYKKCNTVKYLISSTPDGTINYISQGFGGRATDAVIVEESDYLEKLPSNCAVMADRGFKHIEPLLKRKNCSLVRPPSVFSNRKSTKYEVMETRRIASLRIHIERIIKRYREFSFLKPHATVPIQSLNLIDDVVIIASALVNLQTPVIAQL